MLAFLEISEFKLLCLFVAFCVQILHLIQTEHVFGYLQKCCFP